MPRLKDGLTGTKAIVYCALFTALLIALSQLVVPLPFLPVPISLGLLAVLLCGCLLGPVWGTATVGLYILMGVIGLPVFAGFKSTAAVLGPTGGYIIGYIPAAFISGLSSGKSRTVFFLGLLAAVLACFLPGVIWTAVYLKTGFFKVLVSSLIFLPIDGIKAAFAGALTIKIDKIYKKRSIS